MNKYLIKLADHLYKKGFYKEADYVDCIIKSKNLNFKKEASFIKKNANEGKILSDEFIFEEKRKKIEKAIKSSIDYLKEVDKLNNYIDANKLFLGFLEGKAIGDIDYDYYFNINHRTKDPKKVKGIYNKLAQQISNTRSKEFKATDDTSALNFGIGTMILLDYTADGTSETIVCVNTSRDRLGGKQVVVGKNEKYAVKYLVKTIGAKGIKYMNDELRYSTSISNSIAVRNFERFNAEYMTVKQIISRFGN